MTKDNLIISDLPAWFKRLPRWQQKAVDILQGKSNLSDNDISDLAESCIQEARGVPSDQEIDIPPSKIIPTLGSKVKLRSISNVSGINRLAPQTPLEFGEDNLSVVFGYNATGKSGYVRILKHIRNAREREPLRKDVYNNNNDIQKCDVLYTKDGVLHNVHWQLNLTEIQDLHCVDIFDASREYTYVTKENELTYETDELILFSDMINVCTKVEKYIDEKIREYPSQLPQLPHEFHKSTSGIEYNIYINNMENINNIDKYLTWNENDDRDLKVIKILDFDKDPKNIVKKLEIQKKHTDGIINKLMNFSEYLSSINCRKIIAAKVKLKKILDSASCNSKISFHNLQLQGVGTDEWQLLWENAKEYSTKQAYIGKSYPNVDKDSLCVLCQQPLSSEAKKRFMSFQEFVELNIEKGIKLAKQNIENLYEGMQRMRSEKDVVTKLDDAGLTSIREDVIKIFNIFRKRLKGLKEETDSYDNILNLLKNDNFTEFSSSIIKALQSISNDHQKNIKKYDETSKNYNQNEIRQRLLELDTKKWIFQQRNAVLSEIKRRKKIKLLNIARSSTVTTKLSNKKRQLASDIISRQFCKRYKKEISQLTANDLKIDVVQSKVAKGKVLHRIQLQNTNEKYIEHILSEGEKRIVSLALFLADVGDKNNLGPFVFDDPITSLDDRYQNQIIQRLIQLSKQRQVIIFTHSVFLTIRLEECCKKNKMQMHLQTITTTSKGTGEPVMNYDIISKPKKIINFLLDNQIPEAERYIPSTSQISRNPYINDICINIRILIEKIIENELLSGIVKRSRISISNGDNLRNLTLIECEDCELLERYMSKYSSFVHYPSEDSPTPTPSIEILKKDVLQIKEWLEKFTTKKQNQKKITPIG